MRKKLFFVVLLALILSACSLGLGGETEASPDFQATQQAQIEELDELLKTVQAQKPAGLAPSPTPTEEMVVEPTPTPEPEPTATAEPASQLSAEAAAAAAEFAWTPFIGEPGHLTASQGTDWCVEPACRQLTPDYQFKLSSEDWTLDCDAGDVLLVAWKYGQLTFGENSYEVEDEKDTGKFTLVVCSEVNQPIQASGYNPGFVLVTNLSGSPLSAGYMQQNIADMYEADNCAGSGCQRVEIDIIDLDSWTITHAEQEAAGEPWIITAP